MKAKALQLEVALATGLDPKACHFSMHPEEKHQWVKKQEDAGEAEISKGFLKTLLSFSVFYSFRIFFRIFPFSFLFLFFKSFL